MVAWSNGMIYSIFLCMTHRKSKWISVKDNFFQHFFKWISIKENSFTEHITRETHCDFYHMKQKNEQNLNHIRLQMLARNFHKKKITFLPPVFFKRNGRMCVIFFFSGPKKNTCCCPNRMPLPINYECATVIRESRNQKKKNKINKICWNWSACDYDKFKRTTGFQ